MIIKRKYAYYGQLKEDKASLDAMVEAILKSEKQNFTIEDAYKMIDRASDVLVLNSNIETGIPGDAFQMFMEEFDELDKTTPFDNGLTYRDVNNVVCFPSRKGNAVMQILYNKSVDALPIIVQVIAFEKDGDSIKPIETWDIGTIGL